jgi:hypothetical protein
VPELAARAHLRWVVPALAEVLKTAGVTIREVDGIAVTAGPGLAGSLLVGIAFAKTLAWAHELPLVGVNHLEGHLYAAWLLDPDELERPVPPFPLVALVVSGGHTFLVEMRDHLTYRLLGETVDLADRDAGGLQYLGQRRDDPAQVCARGELGHDPACRGVERDLAGHRLGQDPAPAHHERDPGLVTG